MNVTNGERLVTKQDLADFYNDIRPYMGGLVTSKAGFTPIGTIISVMGTTAPVNYLACDGTVYNIADYTELANYFLEQFGSKNFFGGNGTTTFAVPDLRGEFLRGTGTNSHENQGSGGAVGVHQDGTLMQNIRSITDSGFGLLAYGKSTNIVNKNMDSSVNDSTLARYLNSNYTSTDVSMQDKPTLFSARPTNTSVLFCIATKNFYIDPTLDYSTEEKIVGTWIDGKPLYQKVITGVVPTTSTDGESQSTFIPIGASIDYGMVVANSILNPVDQTTWYFTPISSNTANNIVFQVSRNTNSSNPNKLRVLNAKASMSGTAFYAVVQYTKTT